VGERKAGEEETGDLTGEKIVLRVYAVEKVLK